MKKGRRLNALAAVRPRRFRAQAGEGLWLRRRRGDRRSRGFRRRRRTRRGARGSRQRFIAERGAGKPAGDLCPRQRPLDRADRRRPCRGRAGAGPTASCCPRSQHRRRMCSSSRQSSAVREAENGLPDGAIKILPIITETRGGVLRCRAPMPARARGLPASPGARKICRRRSARARPATSTAATPTCSAWPAR